MNKALVIVESPAKSKTLEMYLGAGFQVMASYGHVRDLLPRSGAVNTDHDFEMNYKVIKKNQKSVDAIAKAVKKIDTLYLATDPDREGEAISWHLCEILKEKGVLKGKEVKRVVFYEVTKSAIQEAIKHPRDLSPDLINAQQARRALDYLVGFNLSPLLWKKIRRGLSAGRVQSPALRMIVEREEEIEKFKKREYWTIEADLNHRKKDFSSNLIVFNNEKLKKFSIISTEVAESAKQELLKLANGVLNTESIAKKQRRRQPAPPFITSTMQQEAVRKLGFTAQRAMHTAQQLYEGIDTGEGSIGLITYMRTDSVNLASEAVMEIRDYISKEYGKDKMLKKARQFTTKSKNAQEAHEAIRPTSINRVPKEIKSKLTPDQFKLYELIWKRVLACQMHHATINTVSVNLSCGSGNLFRANGSTVVEKGFLAVYEEGFDDEKKNATEKMLPPIEEGDKISLKKIRSEQHFTEPLPRYSEASLVKTLEDYGIGRPSTYAAIIYTLRQREYIEMVNKRFVPTDVGRIVNKFLAEHFTDYVDYDFTAKLEDELDAVSRGEKEWVPLLRDFWDLFSKKLKDKEENVSRSEANQARELGKDKQTGLPVSVRMGKYGPYVQIGSKDDDEKPKFAGLRSGQRIDTITLEDAIELFKLPRDLGQTVEGEETVVNIGRFGPYVRYGNKFVSLKKDDDPYTISLERAIELINEKKKADAEKQIKVFAQKGISILNGKYGPYITDGKKNVKIPKDREPAGLTLEESQALLENAPINPGKRRYSRKAG